MTGRSTGPYEGWQVIGCVLSLVAVALASALLVHPRLPVAVMPLTFSAAWAAQAFAEDDTGLAGVGLLLVLIGCTLGALAVGGIARTVLYRVGSR